MNASVLTRNLTSYDFLKMAAVLLMIVDHIGFYFFPEVEEFRAIGRWCVPIWFFLIGYANSRDLGGPLWIAAGVLIVGDVIAGMTLFPLSIIATIIVVRVLLNILMDFAMESRQNFWTLCVILMFLILPSIFIFEYGAEGFLLAMMGYLLRRQDQVSDVRLDLFVLFVFLIFICAETVIFGFNQDMVILMSAGTVVSFVSIYYFRAMEFETLTRMLPVYVTKFIQFFGRHTLLIYVGHLLAFKALGIALYPDRFPVFGWTFF